MNRLQSRLAEAIVDELEQLRNDRAMVPTTVVMVSTRHPIFVQAEQLQVLAPLLVGALRGAGNAYLADRVADACQL